MIFECRLCNRVKKFGEWIEPSFEFKELVKEIGVETVHVVCPRCEKEVLSASAQRELIRQA